MNNRTLLLFLLMFMPVILGSCRHKEGDKAVAKIYGKVLYLSEVGEAIPDGTNATDSVELAKAFIDNWLKKQLILKKAEQNLDSKQKDVSQLIEDYRTSLLTFRYEQLLVQQKLDTIVSPKDIQEYYKANLPNFMLNDNIVKVVYIKLPLKSPEMEKVLQWYKSTKDEDLAQLEKYCTKYAVKFTYYGDKWIAFSAILDELPNKINNPEGYLQTQSLIVNKDKAFEYLVHIRDHRLKGTEAPIEYVASDIKAIILNKRKLSFINNLENSIYNDAADHNVFKIYK